MCGKCMANARPKDGGRSETWAQPGTACQTAEINDKSCAFQWRQIGLDAPAKRALMGCGLRMQSAKPQLGGARQWQSQSTRRSSSALGPTWLSAPHWTRYTLALTRNNRDCEPTDAKAARFCAYGALVRAGLRHDGRRRPGAPPGRPGWPCGSPAGTARRKPTRRSTRINDGRSESLAQGHPGPVRREPRPAPEPRGRSAGARPDRI